MSLTGLITGLGSVRAIVTQLFGGQADGTLPTVTSATLSTDGVTLTLTLSETTTGTAGFTIRVNGFTRSATWVRVNGTTLVATLSSVAYADLPVTYSYSQSTGNILDTASNELATITSASATNNSTQTAPTGSDTVILRRGPFRLWLESPGGGAECTVDCFVDDQFDVVVSLRDGDDQSAAPVAIASADVTARVTSSAGVALGDDATCTTDYDAGGVVRFTLPEEATAARGTKSVTVLRDGGDGDKQTFGPLILTVRSR